MNTRQGTWAEALQGGYVRSNDGRTWRVERDDRLIDGTLLLQDRAGERVQVTPNPPDGPVTILEPSHEEAVATVEQLAGASVLAERAAPGQPWASPPLSHRLEDIHMHMRMLHGYVTDTGPGSKTVQRLLDFHVEDHGDPASHGWVPHHHPRRTT